MRINKLDLLSKGWKVSEIEHASKIIDEAESNKDQKTKIIDSLLVIVLISLMIVNGVVCAEMLVPLAYFMPLNIVLFVDIIISLVFSLIFTSLIYDIEKVKHEYELKLFILFIVSGIINFYLILQSNAYFGMRYSLPIAGNIYWVAGAYIITFLTPHTIYQIIKQKELNLGTQNKA